MSELIPLERSKRFWEQAVNLTNFLRIPLSMLDSIPDIEAFPGLSPRNLAVLPRDYSAQEIQFIIDALEFAAEHPEFDFAALLPGLRHSNASIYSFLMKIRRSLQAWQSSSSVD